MLHHPFSGRQAVSLSREDSIGRLGREAIYYGADGFYLHQLLNFSRQRYRKDALWLQQNVGISIRPMLNIAKFIVEQVNGRMTAVATAS